MIVGYGEAACESEGSQADKAYIFVVLSRVVARTLIIVGKWTPWS